ncbi:MAG: hypothetical protein ACD_37C00146G0003 [uncultured bacterium]|nr:MAG: hypothetical protein ACD_37C00146G0003 [uncultured bacterium]
MRRAAENATHVGILSVSLESDKDWARKVNFLHSAATVKSENHLILGSRDQETLQNFSGTRSFFMRSTGSV